MLVGAVEQMAKMHDAGFLHNDLKANNIIVVPDEDDGFTVSFPLSEAALLLWNKSQHHIPTQNERISKHALIVDFYGYSQFCQSLSKK